MAATATATVGSSLCIPNNTLITKHLTTDPFLVKVHYSKKLLHSPLVCYGITTEPIHITSIFHKWRVPRITPTVAQQEALQTAPENVETSAEQLEEQEKTGGEEGDKLGTKLYFGNLPYHCDSAQLAGIVQQYATPELVEVLYNRDTGKSRGFAFVTMSTVEDCNAVINNLDGCEYGGRYLRVNFADKPRRKEPLYPETEHKLFIGNLSWSVTSESLYQAFRAYGNVVGARVLFDGDTGKSRGYGFVCYATRSEMENALASLNGMDLEGRAMRVCLAEGKKV